MSKPLYRVLLLGGYGFFGRHLLHLLTTIPNLSFVIAGRRLRQAYQLKKTSEQQYPEHEWIATQIDTTQKTQLLNRIKETRANLVIDLNGLFNEKDYCLVKICLELQIHYIDFANDGNFVNGITAFQTEAIQREVMLISGFGASAISSAAVSALAHNFKLVDKIEISTSLSTQHTCSLGSTQSILQHCGKKINIPQAGKQSIINTWQHGLKAIEFPYPIGKRWLNFCDSPNYQLLPKIYPHVRSINIKTGLESPITHFMMVGLSILRKLGPSIRWQKIAPYLKKIAHYCKPFGSGKSIMQISVYGYDFDDKATHHDCLLIAEKEHGAYLPLLACTALIRKIVSNIQHPNQTIGAFACQGLVNWQEITHEIDHLNIHIEQSIT